VSGYIAREAVQLSNITTPYQAFGTSALFACLLNFLYFITGLITQSNVTFVDQISGIMGLGFERLSSIPHTVTNCADILVLYPLMLTPKKIQRHPSLQPWHNKDF